MAKGQVENLSKVMDDLSSEIKRLSSVTEGMLGLAADGFEKFRTDSPQKVTGMEREFSRNCEKILKDMVSLSEGLPEEKKSLVKLRISAVNHLQMIGDCCRDFAEQVVVKLREGLLFSDKAFKEIRELYVEVASLMRQAFAAFHRGDHALVERVDEKASEVEKLIDSFSSEHEKRLITGLCNVKSSSLYLDMLDAMRRISGHAVSISRLA